VLPLAQTAAAAIEADLRRSAGGDTQALRRSR
jgi:hypothetical protein